MQVVPAYYELLRAPSEQQAQARRYPLLQALSELENLFLTRQGFGDDEAESPFLCDEFSLAEVRTRSLEIARDHSRLQPCAPEAAALCTRGCSPMHPEAAALCTRGCSLMHSRLQPWHSEAATLCRWSPPRGPSACC